MGTWAVPDTEKKANKLAELMKSKISASTAKDKLYYLVGDDELFDELDKAEKENRQDVRYAVKQTLKDWLGHLDDFFDPIPKEVIAIWEKIVKKKI